jgi:hypothetical protein
VRGAPRFGTVLDFQPYIVAVSTRRHGLWLSSLLGHVITPIRVVDRVG